MEGWNGGWGSWSYRHKIGSNVSSSSGTIVSNLSTAYASSGSRLSTLDSAAMHFDSLGIHEDNKKLWWEGAEKAPIDLVRSLVLEFFGAPSASCSIKRGNMSVVERWLKGLGVGWVLSLQDGASAGHDAQGPRWLKKLGVNWLFSLQDGASAGEDDRERISCWIWALKQIIRTLYFAWPLFPDGSVGLLSIFEEEEEGEPVADNSVPDQYHLELFIQETMLKILTFVDVLVAWDPDTIEYSAMGHMYTKLYNLLRVHDALSEASNEIVSLFDSPRVYVFTLDPEGSSDIEDSVFLDEGWNTKGSVEVERIKNEMLVLLSSYKSKLSEPIRSKMEKIRMISMEYGDDSPSPLDPQGSSDIHKVTWSVIAYINFLNDRSRVVNQAMQGHVPCTENVRPLDNMIAEMVSSLQEKLVNISESFSDQGLKLLFLLNNSDEIRWRLESCLRGPELLDVEHKIEGYMERYLQVSWAPLLSCLCNSTTLCLGKNYSLLSKFESEFQKICTTQMNWKVPGPGLRIKLRQAISDKIIPGYTEYIEDKNVTRPKISPQELKAKLQELFEG